MGVHIDPARRDHKARGIDLALAGTLLAADRGNTAAVHGDVAGKARFAGAIDNGAAANDDVVDGWTLPLPVAVLTLTGSLIFRDERLVRTDDREDPPAPPLASVKKPYDTTEDGCSASARPSRLESLPTSVLWGDGIARRAYAGDAIPDLDDDA